MTPANLHLPPSTTPSPAPPATSHERFAGYRPSAFPRPPQRRIRCLLPRELNAVLAQTGPDQTVPFPVLFPRIGPTDPDGQLVADVLERRLLPFTGFLSDVHKHPVDLDLPDQGIVAQAARQGPIGIEPPDTEHSPDSHRLSLAGACGRAKLRVDVDQLHVGKLLGIIQHVRPANGSDNSASPDFLPATGKGCGSFSSEGDCESPTHLGVFLVQVPLAEGIGQCRDRLVLRANIGWNCG